MPTGAIIGVIAMLALMFWNFKRWYEFDSRYRFSGQFLGERYECNLRFADRDHGNVCFVGANELGLYLLEHPGRKSWWSYRSRLKENFQIPWNDLKWRAGTLVYCNSMWFEVPSKKIYFYIAKDVAEKLLRDARQTMPA